MKNVLVSPTKLYRYLPPLARRIPSNTLVGAAQQDKSTTQDGESTLLVTSSHVADKVASLI